MKKVLGACLTLLSSAVLFIVLLLASGCGSGGSGGFPAGTNNTNPSQVVKYPVYQVDCSTLSSDVTVTTVIAQAKWDTSGKLISESFTPKNVTIPWNGVVQWVNKDYPDGVTAPLNSWNGYNIYSDGWVITQVTSSTTVTSDVSAYIGPVPPNNTLCIQFGTPGTYNYHCDVKTGAVGSVTVLNPPQ